MDTDVQDSRIPETCEEALALWDAGEYVWSGEMGGIGPIHEQQIQVMAFECVRYLMDKDMPPVHDTERNIELDKAMIPICIRAAVESGFGPPSNIQAQAAKNIACVTKRSGWRTAIRSLPPDRRIMVKRTFP